MEIEVINRSLLMELVSDFKKIRTIASDALVAEKVRNEEIKIFFHRIPIEFQKIP